MRPLSFLTSSQQIPPTPPPMPAIKEPAISVSQPLPPMDQKAESFADPGPPPIVEPFAAVPSAEEHMKELSRIPSLSPCFSRTHAILLA